MPLTHSFSKHSGAARPWVCACRDKGPASGLGGAHCAGSNETPRGTQPPGETASQQKPDHECNYSNTSARTATERLHFTSSKTKWGCSQVRKGYGYFLICIQNQFTSPSSGCGLTLNDVHSQHACQRQSVIYVCIFSGPYSISIPL